MMIAQKAKKLLKNNKGFADHYIAVSVCVLILIAVISIGFAAYGGIHQYSQLNVFADEMAQTVANAVKTEGTQVSERYSKLSSDTGLTPDIEYTANYYDSNKKTVQYGDNIQVKLRDKITLSAFGNLKTDIDVTIEKSSQSQQYWK